MSEKRARVGVLTIEKNLTGVECSRLVKGLDNADGFEAVREKPDRIVVYKVLN